MAAGRRLADSCRSKLQAENCQRMNDCMTRKTYDLAREVNEDLMRQDTP